MRIPYRTRRLISRIGFISTVILIAVLLFWLCWVIFVSRYVVYTRDGAVLDMSYSSNDIFGELAVPPQSKNEVSIYYNEGANSIEIGNALTQLDGYYIDSEALTNDISGVWSTVETLPMGTAVLISVS